MSNWWLFIGFYLALSIIILALVYLVVKALIAIIRMEKNMRDLIDLLVKQEKKRQQDYFGQN